MSLKNYGFIRVASISPRVYLGDIEKNTQNILELVQSIEANILLFPELCLTGGSMEDLFRQPVVLEKSKEALLGLMDATKDIAKFIVVGLPMLFNRAVYNTAALLFQGKILGIAVKTELSIVDSRCFSDIAPDIVYFMDDDHIPVETGLCLDLEDFRIGLSLNPANARLAKEVDILLQPAFDAASVDTYKNRAIALEALSREAHCAIAYANAGFGESTSYASFDGYCTVYEDGECLAVSSRYSPGHNIALCDVDMYSTQYKKSGQTALAKDSSISFDLPAAWGSFTNLKRPMAQHPFFREGEAYLAEIAAMQANALLTRLQKINCKTVVLGLSGGLDSSVCLLASYLAYQKAGMDVQNIINITMPGFGTGKQTKSNADDLLESLGLTALNINITASVRQHFADIGQDENVHDITFENSQARERTQILMDYANKINGIVLGTGDLSETALGFCTYNGDHMSMYSMCTGIPKTVLRPYLLYLGKQISPACLEVCKRIVATPVSPELLPVSEGELQQKTEGILGSYDLHDFFLYHFIEDGYDKEKLLFVANQVFAGKFPEEEIKRTLDIFFRRFFSQQFKRNCTADGVSIYSTGLSPHKAWKMPSDLYDSLWKS